MFRCRLDDLLVSRGIVETKNKAHGLIMAGDIMVNGKIITKVGTQVSEDSLVELVKKLPYVSRGGIKLECALNEFNLDVTSLIALDIGASTGGFTDCLLEKGVSRVYAMDVGYGQLDYKLRRDARVTVLDKINAHYPFLLPEKVDLVVADVSFISITKVIPNLIEHLKSSGYIVVLLKPQFEAEKQEVVKGGVIKDPLTHAVILGRFILWAKENRLRIKGLIESPIRGAKGNHEFLVWLMPY
jgi:23S rRNA (cytidine1920-2'-O)/16S rRNA (cytidine1409-2'-O)-methyltransferase